MTKRDIDHLKWIHDRMVYVHEENYHYDYMIRLRQIINELNGGENRPCVVIPDPLPTLQVRTGKPHKSYK